MDRLRLTRPFQRWSLVGGVGTGDYRRESDALSGRESIGLFGSVAASLSPRSQAFASWTGQDLAAGVSFRPFASYPLIIRPAYVDLTRSAGDGPRFVLGVAYGYSF
jgi:hypothetical protein